MRLLSVVTFVLLATGLSPLVVSAEIKFTELSLMAGVRSVHNPLGYVDMSGNPFQNGVGQGAAWLDMNHDGWPDLIVTNGTDPGNHCYLNNGDGTFTDVSEALGVRVPAVVNSVVAADVNNDSFPDLFYANHLAEPEFMRGHRFGASRVTSSVGLQGLFFPPGTAPSSWDGPLSMGAAYGDYDNDGFIDVYLANYLFASDLLLQNLSGGAFANSRKIVEPEHGYGCMPMFFDYDNDGDQDIFVVNDLMRDFLFRNDGAESGYTFTEVANETKIAGGRDQTYALSMGMGVAIGDYDNDLDLDVYVTNFRRNALWENPGQWTERTDNWRERGQEARVSFPLNSWGADWFDADNDGDLDLFMVGGWVEGGPDPQPLEIPNRLWRNDGAESGWKFTNITLEAGVADTQFGRAQATADYDRDGDVDIFVTNISYYDPAPIPGVEMTEGHTLLYRNDTDRMGNSWVSLRLQGKGPRGDGTGCNRDAIGCRVYVTAGGVTQMREVQAGSGFMGQNSLEQEFGLGPHSEIDEVKVVWTGNREEVFAGVRINSFNRLLEGTGLAKPAPAAFSQASGHEEVHGVHLNWVTEPWMVGAMRFFRATGDEPPTLVELPYELDGGHGSAFDENVAVDTTYRYYIAMELDNGDEAMTHSLDVRYSGLATSLPQRPTLGQNFPNPFNPSTRILVSIPRDMQVRVSLFDANGRRVRLLYDEFVTAGDFHVDWDAKDDRGKPVGSGVYYYSLETQETSLTRKMVLAY